MRLIHALFLLLLALPGHLVAGSPLVIATSDGVPLSTPDGRGFHDQVVREAFRRVGIAIETVHLPAERSLINANEGIEDGVYVRVTGLEQAYPNLMVVPEKVNDYVFVAFGKDPSVRIEGWESLRSYHVAIITGWKILEKNILHYRSLTKVKNAELLFQALVEDKVDLVVYNRLDGYGSIKEMGLQGIFALNPPLDTREMFLYMHKDRGSLIPQLAAALRAMKSDGTYDRLRAASLDAYLPK